MKKGHELHSPPALLPTSGLHSMIAPSSSATGEGPRIRQIGKLAPSQPAARIGSPCCARTLQLMCVGAWVRPTELPEARADRAAARLPVRPEEDGEALRDERDHAQDDQQLDDDANHLGAVGQHVRGDARNMVW